MKTVHLKDGRVTEVIPEYATPVETWYGKEFAAECMEAPDEVQPNWRYLEGKFYGDEGQTESRVTLEGLQEENKLLKAQLQAQTARSDFIEDCIAEMAMTVYSEV